MTFWTPGQFPGHWWGVSAGGGGSPALVSALGGIFFPDTNMIEFKQNSDISTNDFAGLSLSNAADAKVFLTFQCPKDMTIAGLEYHTGWGTPGAGNMDFRLETVDLTTGHPSGTLVSAGTNASITPPTKQVWNSATLDTNYSASKGELLAIGFVNPSTDYSTYSAMITGLDWVVNNNHRFPSGHEWNGSSWTSGVIYYAWRCVLRLSDGSYAHIPKWFPFKSYNEYSYDSATTPDERGLRFKLPMNCKISGAQMYVETDGDFNLKVYDKDDNELVDRLIDDDLGLAGNGWLYYFDFGTDVTINADEVYRVTLEPTGAGNVSVYTFEVDDATIMDAIYGGQDAHLTERTDGGAWTDTTTERPFISLLISELSDGG